MIVIPPRSWSASSRENVTLSGVYPPAWLLVTPAETVGANRGGWQPVISNGKLDGVAASSNGALHGVSSLSAL